MITWTQAYEKARSISGDQTTDTLLQLKQDINIGYHRFNAALDRYFSRKQQFTDVVEGQLIYQTPIDCIRIIGMSIYVNGTFQQVVSPIRSEFEWRQITAYPYNSNWPALFYMIGNDSFQVWPSASQDVIKGIRFYYQQSDHDLSIDDITSSGVVATVTVTNDSTLVTASSGVFNQNMIGLQFQLTGVTDLSWYEIVDVPTTSTLTLKSKFVGFSGGGQAWRIGQTFIFPSEYDDVPVDYALARYYEAKNNPGRAAYHRKNYEDYVTDAIEKYASSTEGNVITDDMGYISAWLLTPMPPNM